MTIDNLSFVRPTNEIKYLLKLRGSNLKIIAEQTGVSYTVLSKFLSNTDTRASKYHKAPHIIKALAGTLGIPEPDLMNRDILHTLIDLELQKMKAAEMEKQKRHFKGRSHRWSLKRFFRNLMKLGQPGYYHYDKHEEEQ